MDTDMHTHMQGIANNGRPLILGAGLLLFSNLIWAGDLSVNASAAIDLYTVDSVSVSRQGAQNVEGQVSKLSFLFGSEFKSKKLNMNFSGQTKSIDRKTEPSSSSSYTNYNLNTELKLTDSLQFINLYSLSQRNANTQFGMFSDEIVGSESLVDVKSHSSSLVLAPKSSRFIRLNSSLSYSKVKSDDDSSETQIIDQFSQDRYNTETKAMEISIANGTSIKAVDWNITLSRSSSDRGELLGGYDRGNMASKISVNLNRYFSWVANMSVNRNLIGDARLGERVFNYSQAGTGVRFKFNRGSYLSVLGYSSKSGDQERRNFIGGDFNWILSKRTRLNFTLDRNEFGQAYGLNLTQANRYFSTNAYYREGIDINSRQSGFSAELNDEVVKSQLGSFSLTYNNMRKVSMSAGYNYSRQESLEDSTIATNNRKSSGLSVSAEYQWTKKTSVSAMTSWSNIDYLSTEVEPLDEVELPRQDKNKTFIANIKSQLTKKTTAKLEITRRLSDSSRSGFNTQDNRINLNLRYSF